MKRAATRIAVAVVGVLALAAPAAHAGAGAGGGTTTIAGFLCYTIKQGDKQNITAGIENEIGQPAQVVIKRSGLVCSPTTITVPEGEVTSVISEGDHLGCYKVSVPGPDNVKQPAQLETPLDTEETLVKVPKFVCFYSNLNIVGGTSTPD